MPDAQLIQRILSASEQAVDLVDKKSLQQALNKSTANGLLTLVTFSCLATEKDREELIIDLFRTAFFFPSKKVYRQAQGLVESIQKTGLQVTMKVILVDTEPCRTWGWQVSQGEITTACQMMAEDASLPTGWQTCLWSDLEKQSESSLSFNQCLEHARQSGKHNLLINQQAKHLAKFADRYHFVLPVREMAVRQVAAYGWEGIVLKQIFPDAILIQSENPWKEKDPLHNWLLAKDNQLAVIHPLSI